MQHFRKANRTWSVDDNGKIVDEHVYDSINVAKRASRSHGTKLYVVPHKATVKNCPSLQRSPYSTKSGYHSGKGQAPNLRVKSAYVFVNTAQSQTAAA